ncbi:hypothetical protein [Amycolatopsis sp. NPDC059021]|uniref:poly(ethylene terephthalate) hydrolase family protein n=1 Tax=Amycolatopsis sp. NPDC059021 TaxID=3346704 RepID=UPI00366B4EDB
MHRWVRALQAAVAAAAAVTMVSTTPAAASPSEPDGTSWSVVPAGAGYQVTLRLPRPLDTRAAAPEIAVNGKSVGVAHESPDRRTLTVVTADPAAAHPSTVQLAWNGAVGGSAPRTTRRGTMPAPGKPTPDPTTTGQYHSTRADYDFGDTALTLPGLGGKAVEERAAVWVPDAPGKRPVAIFLHGAYEPCYDASTGKVDDTHWPCPTGFAPIPSYHGFDQAAEVLASQGYVVVSISANGVNAQDNQNGEDYGTSARGQLVLDHLDLLAKANRGRAPGLSPSLRDKLDLDHVGLMGHSRGGAGVVKAALLNAALPHPYGIRAVLPLAPLDLDRETLPDVPMAVVLPYCDGDVSDQEGQHYYEDTRYAGPDNVLRASLLVMGANHNFFNTQWTPGDAAAPEGDDWQDENDPTCGLDAPATIRLTAAQQHQVGTSYIAGFFRLVLGRENAFLPLFAGNSGSAVTVGAATVLQESQSPASDRLDVAPLQGQARDVRFTGSVTGAYCASMGGRSPQSGLPSCTESTFTNKFPSFAPDGFASHVTASPMLHLSWTGAGAMTAAVPEHDVSRYAALTIRAAIDDTSPSADLKLTVTDGAGRSQSTTLSALSGAMTPLPGTGTLLPKTWLESVRWPISDLTRVDVHDLRSVVLSTATPSGGVFLSDLAFQTAAAGAGGPSRLPRISIEDTTVDVGTTATTATVRLTLSRPSRVPVVANVQPRAGAQIAAAAWRVEIPPGRTSTTVAVPVATGTTSPPPADKAYQVWVAAPANAVLDRNFAHITVHNQPAAS